MKRFKTQNIRGPIKKWGIVRKYPKPKLWDIIITVKYCFMFTRAHRIIFAFIKMFVTLIGCLLKWPTEGSNEMKAQHIRLAAALDSIRLFFCGSLNYYHYFFLLLLNFELSTELCFNSFIWGVCFWSRVHNTQLANTFSILLFLWFFHQMRYFFIFSKT